VNDKKVILYVKEAATKTVREEIEKERRAFWRSRHVISLLIFLLNYLLLSMTHVFWYMDLFLYGHQLFAMINFMKLQKKIINNFEGEAHSKQISFNEKKWKSCGSN